MTIRVMFALLCALLWTTAAHAQGLQRVPSCGTGTPGPGMSPGTQDTTGNGCVSGTFAPGSVTGVALDVASVTTGGTAVNAFSAGHALHGGYIITANAAGMCVDQISTAGTATGVPSTTACVAQNQSYQLLPSSHAVSVNSTASSVLLAGEGTQ